MRLHVSFTPALAAIAALALCTLSYAQDQSTPPSKQSTTPTASPSYISVNPLAGVRYDNRYDLTVGMAYDHMKAGPSVLQGSNLGGLDRSEEHTSELQS